MEGDVELVALRSKLEQALVDVEGWLFLDEAWALHEAIRNLKTNGQPPTAVEIGSWKGRSTVALALGIKARGGGTVFAIDPHTGSPGTTAVGPVVTATDFQRNIAAAGVDSLVKLLVTTSHAARPKFAAKSVDLLFIDGSHEYEDVVRDITDWQTALKDESAVAFNDPTAPGVYRALRELVLKPRSTYRSPSLIQNTLVFTFRRGQSWESRDAVALIELRTVLRLKLHATPFWPYIPRWFVRIAHSVSRRMVGS
ncbi:MAG TPA: class I SAM-dependent methyltransferase [Candidatus Dormibacteraeota bacterium]|nr:class I SAM-dependent methyltransferase [Candidatus Dormibacteraeota bacterium]